MNTKALPNSSSRTSHKIVILIVIISLLAFLYPFLHFRFILSKRGEMIAPSIDDIDQMTLTEASTYWKTMREYPANNFQSNDKVQESSETSAFKKKVMGRLESLLQDDLSATRVAEYFGRPDEMLSSLTDQKPPIPMMPGPFMSPDFKPQNMDYWMIYCKFKWEA